MDAGAAVRRARQSRWLRKPAGRRPSSGTYAQRSKGGAGASQARHLRDQHVTLVAYGADHLRLRAIVEFSAQAADLRVDRAVEHFRAPAVNQVEQLVATEDALRVLHEAAQQCELAVGEIDEDAGGVAKVAAGDIEAPAGETIRA